MSHYQDLAAEARQWFVHSKRNDGTSFWERQDGAPDWVRDLSRDAHGDMLPDDWRYEALVEVLGALAENSDPDNAYDSYESDTYNKDLFAWLASHVDRQTYVDEAMDGWAERLPLVEQIGHGQVREKQEIHCLVITFLDEFIDAIDNTDAEEDA